MDKSKLHLPAALIIMDGFGIAEPGPGNAISLANTPHLDHLRETASNIQIQASGEYVGLPDGQMGNSEVGHLNIGAGRIVYQELTRINNACRSGGIAENEKLCAAMERVKAAGSVLHVMGLVSDGGVHSSNEHLYALLKMAAQHEVPHVFVHCFMDGRDVPPASGLGYIEELEERIAEYTTDACRISIASISGRYYAMDRDNRWERVKKAFDAIAHALPHSELSPTEFMQASYDAQVTDEFVVPGSFATRGVEDDDAVIFFNFRPDRARQITHAFVDAEPFESESFPRPYFVCLTEYDPEIPADIAFAKEFPENVLADVLSSAGLKQYHIAETEKYAHVTFFLNGGIEAQKEGERRQIIDSPKVATYDLQPEMSEPAVAQTLADAIDADTADVYIVNFANCDMVGHTGSIPAATAAVEAVDAGVGQVLAAIERKGGVALVTADHGNADKMIAEDGQPHTAHTTNPVPLFLADYAGLGYQLAQPEGTCGALCNLAPTLLQMIGLEVPAEMTAPSLLA
ncbi:phosphoglyceromutase [Denitrobacterium detoxificans]|uniref:2,3-bisphosphoglycerate-independent phosphoglycerate mutase n=1 Tax=Denitrobacterium detoxificans TaxID=79604 RepID=A0A172RY69_9ACTN|nr:2,3-bisphosphoglycerate-independent phosphoglycerate mutase [Denitrobacterium detoxificans]ANE22671.1 phosphoglyceromutase [Denitrobacterium detoxificans]SEO86612.1 phosphoglycerate mutase [Denitrobacterium detoxificans]